MDGPRRVTEDVDKTVHSDSKNNEQIVCGCVENYDKYVRRGEENNDSILTDVQDV